VRKTCDADTSLEFFLGKTGTGLSKKWEIIMDRRQDSNVALTPAETIGPSAQHRYYARSLGRCLKKRYGNVKK